MVFFMGNLQKTRDIPIGDFYSLLQLEFISYKARELLYERPEDKKKFNDIGEKKRQNIESISMRKCLPSIFNDEGMKTKYVDKFINEWGLPNFCYRDEYQAKVKGLWDRKYFFHKGCLVKVKDEDNSVVDLTIISYSDSDDSVIVTNGEVRFKTLSINVKREFKDFLIKNI